jgi:hypothetical protein
MIAREDLGCLVKYFRDLKPYANFNAFAFEKQRVHPRMIAIGALILDKRSVVRVY